MNYIDILTVAIIVVILGLAIGYIRRAKKKGIKSNGSPEGAKCSGNCCGKQSD